MQPFVRRVTAVPKEEEEEEGEKGVWKYVSSRSAINHNSFNDRSLKEKSPPKEDLYS